MCINIFPGHLFSYNSMSTPTKNVLRGRSNRTDTTQQSIMVQAEYMLIMICMCLYKGDIFVISLIVNSFTCK